MDPNIMEGALTPQDIFNLKVDTQARWDKISSMKDNFDVPAPNFPDYDFNRSPMDTSSQMSIYDGLFSDNPLIKQNAKAAIAQSVANTPEMKHNVGFHIDTDYEQAKKYVGKEYGFDPTRDNEDFYYKNTYLNKTLAGRSLENIGEGVGRFVGSVVTKLGQTVGHLGAMVGSGIEEIFDHKGNNWLQDVAENSFTKWFENAEETIKDQWMPVFKPSGWDEMGFFEKMKHGTFWSDEVSDGAAFMGAMIAETFLMAGIGRAAGLSGLAAKTITGSSNLAKLARGAMKFTTGADDLGGVGTWALTVTGESMFEASSVFKHNKQKLIEDREAGKNSFSDEKINEIAGEKAASAFKGNLAVLGISNAFENRFIFQPLMRKMRGKGVNFDETPNRLGSSIKVGDKVDNMDDFARASSARPEYTGKADRYLNIRKKLKDPQGALNFYGSRALRAVAMEGYWEENAQLAIERLSNDGKLNAKNFVKQHFDQIVDARKGKDNEASTSIGLGAIIGIAGGAGTSIVTRERRKLKEATLKAIQNYENVRKQYLSFQNVYETDESTGEIKKDANGQPVINKDKAKAVIAGLDEHLSKLVTAEQLANPFLRNMLKEQLLSKFVFAAKAAGIHESVAARFNSLGNLTKDQIAKLGFDPSTPENIPAFQEAFAEQSKIYDEVFLAKQTVNKPKHIKENEWEEKDWSRKTELYGTLTTIRATQKALREYTILGAERDAATNKGIKSPFGAYNSILVQLGKLEQFAKSLPAGTTFYDEFIQKRKKELMQEGEQYRSQIADMQKKGGTGELFGFDVDYEKYSKYFDEEGNLKEGKEQELIEEFVFEREDIAAHGSLTNAIAQNQYLAFKLKDKKEGYKNYEEYMKYKASIEEIDDEVDEEDAPEEEKQDIKTEQEELEANLKEEEEKKKAEEEAAKLAEEEERKKAAEEEVWRKANPLEAKLKDIKNAILAFAEAAESLSPEDKEALKDAVDKENFFELVGEILYGTEFTDEEIAALNEIQQMYIDYSEAKAASLVKEEDDEEEGEMTPEQHVAEWLNEGFISGPLAQMAENDPLGFLKFISQQAQDRTETWEPISGPSAAQSVRDQFTNAIVDYAIELFPAPVIKPPVPTEPTEVFTVEGFAKAISEGHHATTAEELQFYQNNAEAIEAELVRLQKQQAPPASKTDLTPDALAALQEAYDLQNQAMEQMMSYEDLLRSMSIYLNENKIDEAVDEGKMNGVVVIPTMKPNEIKPDGTLTVAEKLYLQARFAFLQRLADSGNTEDFKLVLYVDEKSGTVKAKVADTNNKVLKFDTTGAQSDKGVEVIFDLDLISYDNNSLPKERVEASGQKQDPMKKAMKNFQLHESFVSPSGNPYLNVDRQIVEFIKKSPNVVTASINFVTQGQLVRPGITNNPNSKTDLSGKRETLAELKKAGKVYNDDNGVVAKDNIVQNNTFIKSGRLNVRLKRNVADAKDGFEIVEFIPTTIANAVDHNGKPLADTLKPILEAAIKGELSSEYAVFLRNILNPREFLILNLGNVVLVTNTKKFVKMVSDINAAKSADLLAEKILSLTTIDDLLNTELNIDASLYQDTDNYKQAAQSYPDEVADIIENYKTIIANNVTSSAQQVKIGDGKEGVARVNKRLIVSLDVNFEDMKNSKITTDQEVASNPEGVEIQVDKLDKNTIVDILTSEQPLMEDGKEITVDDALNKLNDCL